MAYANHDAQVPLGSSNEVDTAPDHGPAPPHFKHIPNYDPYNFGAHLRGPRRPGHLRKP